MMTKTRRCSVCPAKHYAKTYCTKHYYLSKKYGNTERVARRQDGISKHPLYVTYNKMVDRCVNLNSPDYKDYGGRGIKVCERWLENIDNFIADIGERPEGYSLNRIDNDKGYSPENCEWSSPRNQALNTRKNTEHPNIYWNKLRGKWYVQGFINSQYIYGGYHETMEAAVEARQRIGL